MSDAAAHFTKQTDMREHVKLFELAGQERQFFELAGQERQPSRFPVQTSRLGKISYQVQTSLNGKSARLCFFLGQTQRLYMSDGATHFTKQTDIRKHVHVRNTEQMCLYLGLKLTLESVTHTILVLIARFCLNYTYF